MCWIIKNLFWSKKWRWIKWIKVITIINSISNNSIRCISCPAVFHFNPISTVMGHSHHHRLLRRQTAVHHRIPHHHYHHIPHQCIGLFGRSKWTIDAQIHHSPTIIHQHCSDRTCITHQYQPTIITFSWVPKYKSSAIGYIHGRPYQLYVSN